jgi:hypothetical protein
MEEDDNDKRIISNILDFFLNSKIFAEHMK